MVVHLARDDSDVIPVPTPALRWFSTTQGPLISDIYGRLGSLAHHDVAADGTVTPSVLMAGGALVPEWHEWVVLDGWDRGTQTGPDGLR
jgi:hypothetical protein